MSRRAKIVISVSAVPLVTIGMISDSLEDRAERRADGPSGAITVYYRQVGYQEGASDIFGTYFVYVDLVGVSDEVAFRDLRQIAKRLCATNTACIVNFWDDESRAADSLPMTRAESNSVVASYNINRNTGSDEFQCHAFGDPGQRCATF